MGALVFLGLYGERLEADPNELYASIDGVARGEIDKAQISVFFRRLCTSR